MNSRNRIESGLFVLEKIDTASKVFDFDCGDPDLNDYFNRDSAAYKDDFCSCRFLQ